MKNDQDAIIKLLNTAQVILFPPEVKRKSLKRSFIYFTHPACLRYVPKSAVNVCLD